MPENDTIFIFQGFENSKLGTILATEKNKKRIVPSLDVTKSDFTVGFSVIDLVEKEVWLVDFSWNVGFSELEI